MAAISRRQSRSPKKFKSRSRKKWKVSIGAGDGRRVWRWFWSAMIRRRTFTCASKEKACREVGIKSFEHLLPATIAGKELLALVHQLNKDNDVHGILVQLPLPPHIRAEKVFEAISPAQRHRWLSSDESGNVAARRRRLRAVHAARHHEAAGGGGLRPEG